MSPQQANALIAESDAVEPTYLIRSI
jgi:hypothetical protein